MAASVQLNIFNGSTPTQTSAVSSMVLGNADSATITTAANPIAAGTNSYEKWFNFQVTNLNGSISISNCQVYFTGTLGANATLKYGQTGTYTAPTSAASTIATTAIPTAAGTENLFIGTAAGGSLTAAGTTQYGVLQVVLTSAATAGMSAQTLVVAYNEVA